MYTDIDRVAALERRVAQLEAHFTLSQQQPPRLRPHRGDQPQRRACRRRRHVRRRRRYRDRPLLIRVVPSHPLGYRQPLGGRDLAPVRTRPPAARRDPAPPFGGSRHRCRARVGRYRLFHGYGLPPPGRATSRGLGDQARWRVRHSPARVIPLLVIITACEAH